MSRPVKIAFVFLAVWVALAIYWLQGVQQVTRVDSERTEARARREVTQPPVASASDRLVKARLYRLAAGGTSLEPVEVQLPLSAEPAVRARQLVAALVAVEPKAAQHALPPDTALLEFYLLPQGAAVADFSGALASAMPSGILSEQLAVAAITRTLADNMPDLQRVKIVIAGQEVETLAGHMDLSNFFYLRAPELPASPASPAPAPAADGAAAKTEPPKP